VKSTSKTSGEINVKNIRWNQRQKPKTSSYYL